MLKGYSLLHFHGIYYRIYHLEKTQLSVNLVRIMAAHYAEDQVPKTYIQVEHLTAV